MQENPPASLLDRFSRSFWDRRYREHEHVWSGNPNAQLVARVSELPPARALDVACGEGADALWLAQRGWTVTGVDVSPVGLRKAAHHAQRAGELIAARIEWREVDIFGSQPVDLGQFDLVASHYLHLPPEVRKLALARVAAAVAAHGHLLFVAHHPSDLEIPGLRPNIPELFQTAEELASQLEPAEWEVLETGASPREQKTQDGRVATVHDAVLFARRRA